MMKRRGYLFAMITALGLMGFACGRTGSDGQVLETQSNETKSVGTIAGKSTGSLSIGAEPAGGSPNGFASAPFNLALRDWSGQVGLFMKAEGKDLQTLQLHDGTVFVGEVTAGAPDGHGVLTKVNGTNLEGEWRRGKVYRVNGTWVENDGTKEIGTWNYDGSPSSGTIIWKDGRVYDGGWRVMEGGDPELPDGTGTMTWPNGRTYTGHFLDGEMDGAGKMSYPDGTIEEGTWMLGKFTGSGPTPQRTMPNDLRIIE
jgi:hypothetical protein